MTENSQATDNLFETQSTQMAFSVTGSRELSLSVDKPADSVCDYLAHHIARKPQDLLAHVQRIKLAAEHNLKPALHGALLDLFVVLGSRGYELRKSMLDRSADRLESGCFQYLHDGLEKGVKANEPAPDFGISVLAKNIMGSLTFMQSDQALDDSDHGPLEQALANIECSQLEDAQEVLESAIYADTSSLEQQALLLDLYKKTDNKTRFSGLYFARAETTFHNQEAWQDMARHFGVEH